MTIDGHQLPVCSRMITGMCAGSRSPADLRRLEGRAAGCLAFRGPHLIRLTGGGRGAGRVGLSRAGIGYWLKEIVEPNLAPKTYEQYEMFSRVHIIPYLGNKSLDKLQVRDIRQW